MQFFDILVEKDLQLLWNIQNYIRCHERLESFFGHIVSRHPWNDIGALTWVFFIIGVLEFGLVHFWVVISNLIFCYLASQLIKAKRPVEYDQRLKLVTDISEESYGMPSLESYMSVVVFGHLVFLFRSVLFIVPSLLMIVLIGVSRLYSRSRFPHQIVISYILGALGLTIGMQMCHAIRYEKIHINIHLGTIGPVLYAIMAIFALSIESNQSRLLGISKKEFIRVLSDIINSSSSNSTIDGSDDGVAGKEDEGQQHNLSERSNTTPRAAAFRRAVERASLHNKKGSYIKRDSLYFLQKSLEQRESSRSSRSSASYMSSRDFSDGEFYEGSVL